eukprot:CAMPEP_0175896408 /NCGR_PEP_ID=MMETSP0108-20121206/153_1 /TAXON_ID=195067 ORGANISM="Goniomonas pacifica, Strain CCMP1869" /NCGR_SAMPLE_ID=MMETSP0108 /ASSEMBLY_ACC=CAM_ASM_000204 /LENGTH=64 /DNA_ID=CAMNT_0017217603 /DNA_START=334 /DNA_END=526 /DNA_ORIENTATION=+
MGRQAWRDKHGDTPESESVGSTHAAVVARENHQRHAVRILGQKTQQIFVIRGEIAEGGGDLDEE